MPYDLTSGQGSAGKVRKSEAGSGPDQIVDHDQASGGAAHPAQQTDCVGTLQMVQEERTHHYVVPRRNWRGEHVVPEGIDGDAGSQRKLRCVLQGAVADVAGGEPDRDSCAPGVPGQANDVVAPAARQVEHLERSCRGMCEAGQRTPQRGRAPAPAIESREPIQRLPMPDGVKIGAIH